MKQTWKRLLSLLLACVLVVSALPLSASAQATEPEPTEWIQAKLTELNSAGYNELTKSEVGDSGVWMYMYGTQKFTPETGAFSDLVIIFQPGEGAKTANIPDYGPTEAVPWSNGKPSAVYIADGITGIGAYAFNDISTLEKVEIEDSTDLTKVGEHAFDGCDNLVGPLDLSGVTDLGQYAFNGCERLGSGENNTGVTLSDKLEEIPEHAFYNCALKNVNIPSSCTEIGEGAFAHNSLSAVGELVLPDDLQSIGDSAFYRQPSESETQGITGLVIPESVTYIGENAFYGIKSLSQVELEHETATGLEIKDGAFGNGTMTAFSEVKNVTIGEGEHAITYENVHVGAEFLTNGDVGDLLENGVNCYLGDLKPLKYKDTVLPTCEKDGYHLYEMTLEGVTASGGEAVDTVTVETKLTISHPEHKYVQDEQPLSATCTLPERWLYRCTNEVGTEVRECEVPTYTEPVEDGEAPLEHDYQVSSITNPSIKEGNSDPTVITMTCTHDKAGLHDGGVPASYSWSIPATTIKTSTAFSLGEITLLPTVTNVDGHAYSARLEWNESAEILAKPLEEGTKEYKVKLVIAGDTFGSVTAYNGQDLTIEVQVEKVTLDFSKVEFLNNTRFTGMDNPAFDVTGLPEGVTETTTEYRPKGSQDEKAWTTDVPSDDISEKYEVRVSFTYDTGKYNLPQAGDTERLPGDGYTLEAGANPGTGYIIGDYTVRGLTDKDLDATTIPNLVYEKGKEQATVRISGLPGGAKVVVSWTGDDGSSGQEEEFTANQTSYEVAKITNAGEYQVTIQVTSSAGGKPVELKATGRIAKKTVATPEAIKNLGAYDPKKLQVGVPDSTDTSIYTVKDNKATDAGTHTATATLVDKDNYKWSTGGNEETGEVKIEYTIFQRTVAPPTLQFTTIPYNGSERTALTATNPNLLKGIFDSNGGVAAYWAKYYQENGDNSPYLVYTATNVKKTDAGKYTITVTLNNTDEAQNYRWNSSGIGDTFTYEWEITPMQVNAPTVKAADATYTGLEYDANNITIEQHSSNSDGILTLGTDHKYYTNQGSQEAMATAPVNAGTYWVDIDFDFAEGNNPDNYTIVENKRVRFQIKKAPLTLTAPEDNQLTATYTGQAITVPAPTISNYPAEGQQPLKDSDLTYTYKREGEEQSQTQTGPLTLTNVGTYTITVEVSDSCQNYTSENAAEYTFTINAATQTVELASTDTAFEGNGTEGKPYTITKTLGDEPFTVTGTGYVGDTATDANITYESSDSDTATVDEDGKVTLKKATAEGNSVTITVTAAGSENYGQATATYTITVGKGTPTIQASNKEIAYDGATLELSDYQATISGVSGAVDPSEELSYQFYESEEAATQGSDDGKIGIPSTVDEYWLRVYYPGDANYVPASKVVKVTITNADLSITPIPYNEEYDGKEHAPAAFTVKGVGNTTLEAEGYTVSFAKKEGTYVENAPAADAGTAWSKDLTVKDVADSGQFWYKIEAESYDPHVGEDPITVTISPKPLQIKKDVTARKPYNGTKEATVDFKTINTGVDGEEISVTNTRAEYDSAEVNASSIIITYTLTEENDNTNLDNYSVSTGGTPIVNGSGKETVKEVNGIPVGIYPASITVAINDQKKVYDGSAPTVANVKDTNWEVKEGKIYQIVPGEDDNLGITLSIAAGSKDAGTYAITGKWNNDNYAVTFTGSWDKEDDNEGEAGTYTITHRPIDVKIGNAEGFYGDAPDKTKVELTDISESDPNTGLVSGDSLETFLSGVKIKATASSGVRNDYSIVGTAQKYGNYDVTFSSGIYTVKARPITITIEDAKSAYGCEISNLSHSVALTDEGEGAYTGKGTDAIVNNDELGITLTTTAKQGSNAGTYSISGKTEGNQSVVGNYAITWKGETAFEDDSGTNTTMATYTVEKAELTVKAKQTAVYAQYGQETANPLTFTNASTGEEITVDDSNYEILENAVDYTLNPADSLTMEMENKAEGKFTVNVTDTTVTVTVNVSETTNYKAATEITYYVYTSASGSLTVTLPFENLTYTSEELQLLTEAPTLPEGVAIRYSLNGKDWTEYSDVDSDNWKSLVGTDAGDYTVYWETKAGGNYSASSGHETTEIQKANLKAAYEDLESGEVTLVLSAMGDTYTIPLDLTGNAGYTHSNGDGVTFLSGNTDVAFAKNSTATLELRGVAGEANITINCPGDDNYNPGTFTFTVKVVNQLETIEVQAEDKTVVYNGQPQSIDPVTATNVEDGKYTVLYADQSGNYTLTDPPAYVNVKRNGGSVEAYTINFQITAPGYETATGEAKLTIEPKSIEKEMVTGIAESYTYVNSQIRPETVAVVDDAVILEKDTDYTITYGDNKEVGKDSGSVTIKGTGNYTGEVVKYFAIKAVDGSDLTASLDRTFGYYGDSDTNNATVKVMHGNLHEVDSSEIELTVTRKDDTSASSDVTTDDLKLTFKQAGIYTIHVEVSGTHTGEFDLTYTLLPQDVASANFQVTTEPENRVWTYNGENHAFDVTVTSGGPSLQKDVDFALRYTYLPYVGGQEEGAYDPDTTAFTEAGIYTVIVEGTGNYTGHAELVALIQPRDLSDAAITAAFDQGEWVYNGEAQEPGVTLTYNGTEIGQLKETEYYGNTNAGEAQALSAAGEDCNNFTGVRVDGFTIQPKSLRDKSISATADPDEYYYTGYPITPNVKVSDSERNRDLSIGADFTITSQSTDPGTGTAAITGTGNYKEEISVTFTILPTSAQPAETLKLTVDPTEWTWDNGATKANISVTFNKVTMDSQNYILTVSKDGQQAKEVTIADAVTMIADPGTYTITAMGKNAYNGSTDTETVTIRKIQPELTVTANPDTLSGSGKVTLTLEGKNLPAFAEGEDLSSLLTATAKDEKNAPDLSELEWETDEQTGVMTAELTLPNTSEAYTFTLNYPGNDYYESATASKQVVVAQQIISGGGGGGPEEDQPANPDDTGVSDWLNTKEHLAYLAGYPGGIFGPDQNMTRAEAAQMFYNLLLEKDVEITVEFEDVPEDAWYATSVNSLASLGILSGVGEGRFDPDRSITRAEFTVIAMKFANAGSGGVNIFSDVSPDDWFYSAVVDSTQYGWINGYTDGTFRPAATITRAEVTVIVNHMLGRAADREYVIAHQGELNSFSDVNRGHWGYYHVAEATNAHTYQTDDGTESWIAMN